MSKRRLQEDANSLRRKLKRLEDEMLRAVSSDGSVVDLVIDNDDVEHEDQPSHDGSDREQSIGQPDSDMMDSDERSPSPIISYNRTEQTEDKEPQAETIDPPLPPEIIEALGEAKTKEAFFGPKINKEISKRWGRIILDGLGKEQRQRLMEKILVPENFTLVKAPTLNSEIAAAITDSARTRDKNLEKAQSHLGVGIASIANLVSNLIEGDIPKMEIIRQLSETNQLLLDLHHMETDNRRKLATYSIDKKFLSLIKDAKRDSFLFGEKLGEKIKASKIAEKSGLQIKRSGDRSNNTNSSSISKRGNGRQPRSQSQRGRGSGNRNRGASSAANKQPRYQHQTPKDKPAPK